MAEKENTKARVNFTQLVDGSSLTAFEMLVNKLGTYALKNKLPKPQKGKLLEFLILQANKGMDNKGFFEYQK